MKYAFSFRTTKKHKIKSKQSSGVSFFVNNTCTHSIHCFFNYFNRPFVYTHKKKPKTRNVKYTARFVRINTFFINILMTPHNTMKTLCHSALCFLSDRRISAKFSSAIFNVANQKEKKSSENWLWNKRAIFMHAALNERRKIHYLITLLQFMKNESFLRFFLLNINSLCQFLLVSSSICLSLIRNVETK